MPDFMVMVPGPTINIPEVINSQHHLEPALMGCPDWVPRLSAQIEKRLKTALPRLKIAPPKIDQTAIDHSYIEVVYVILVKLSRVIWNLGLKLLKEEIQYRISFFSTFQSCEVPQIGWAEKGTLGHELT